MIYLKQSTAYTAQIGPFVDDTDGFTPETGLTISQADVRLSKAGALFAQKTDATSATHDENGWYRCPLDTTDTATLGALRLSVQESGALPVFMEFMVLVANVFDTFFGSDALDANVTQWGGENLATQDTSGYPVVTIKDGAGQGEINTDAGQVVNVGAVNGSVNSVVGSVGSVAGNVDGTINGFTTPAKAEIQAETSAALVAINLDHYMKVPVSDDENMSTEVVTNTVLSLVMTGAGDVSSYVAPDDALQSIRDRGDVAWITSTAGSASVVADRNWNFATRILTANTNLENLEVDVTKLAGSAVAETSDGNIAANFGTFYDNADALTIKTVDDVGGGAATVPPSIR